MRIHRFSSIIDCAIRNIDDPSRDVFKEFKGSLDNNLQMSSRHIKGVYEDSTVEGRVTEEEFKDALLEDYDRLLNGIYRSTYIYSLSMEYIAIKYLESHRSEIPALKREIEERQMVYNSEEGFTDNFHENLLLAILALENDYKVYCDNMQEINGEFLNEIYQFLNQYGKEEGFKRYCDKYANMKSVNVTTRRYFLTYAYVIMFGIEGANEVSLKSVPAIAKYKKNYAIREYITVFAERVENDYRTELVNSITGLVRQIDSFVPFEDYALWYAKKMIAIRLPGLRYALPAEEITSLKKEIERIYAASGNDAKVLEEKDKKLKEIDKRKEKSDNPTVRTLFSTKELSKLPLESLLDLNSYYNNRMAKIMQNYGLSLFIFEELGLTMEVAYGRGVSRDDVDPNVLELLLLKYETLRLPIKTFYDETQRDVDSNPEKYAKESIEYEDETSDRKIVVVNVDAFVKDLKRIWKREYQEYFDENLPICDNDLRRDVLFMNKLYNPIFLSYRAKNATIKSEYAYMYYLSQAYPDLNFNFGLVLRSGEKTAEVLRRKEVFVASDCGLTFPNRLHTMAIGYIDFIKAYTGSPLIRLYQGIEDFEYFGEYITAPLLTQIPSGKVKYLKELKKGNNSKDDTVSAVNAGNAALIEHMLYSADRKSVMTRYRIQYTKFDNKGNPIIAYMSLVQYMDSRDGKIYTMNEYGKLVGEDGTIIEMNGEVVDKIKSHDE